MIGKLRIPMWIPLSQGLYLLGRDAKQKCPGEVADHVADECAKMAAKFGDTKVLLMIPAADLFAYACDGMRERGDTDAVEALEQLVKLVKDGKNRKVLATMQYGIRSEKELDETLAKLRTQAVIIANE